MQWEDNPLPLIAMDRASDVRTLTALADRYDFVVLDGAAKLEDMLAVTSRVCYFVLIRVQPSPYEMWAVSDILRHHGAALSGATAPLTVHPLVATPVLRVLDKHGLGTLRTAIAQRQAYPQTAAAGQTVFDRGGCAWFLMTITAREEGPTVEGQRIARCGHSPGTARLGPK